MGQPFAPHRDDKKRWSSLIKNQVELVAINYFAKDEYDVEVKGGPLGMKFQPIPGEIGGVQVREISNGGYGDRGGVKVGELLIAVNTDVVDKEPYDNIISKINSYKVGRNSNGEVMMLRFKRK